MIKARRFFFHYNKPASLRAGTPQLSFHTNGQCRIVDKVICKVPVESKINKKQPRVVMQGFANAITFKYKGGKDLYDLYSEVIIQNCEQCEKTDKSHLCSFN